MTFTYSGKEDVAAAVASSELIAELRTHKSIRLNVYKDFSDIVNIKYDGNEEEINKNEDNDFDRVMYLGLIAWKKEEDGYEIIHDGKPADKRILKKLGKIAYIFSQFDSYPKINGTALIPILNKTLERRECSKSVRALAIKPRSWTKSRAASTASRSSNHWRFALARP